MDCTRTLHGLRDFLLTLGVGLSFWLVVALIDTGQSYLLHHYRGGQCSLLVHLHWSGPFWVLAGLLTPFVVGLTRWVPFRVGRRGWALTLYLVGCPVFAALLSILYRFQDYALDPRPFYPGEFWYHLPRGMSSDLVQGVLVYAVVLVAALAVDYYRSLRRKEETARVLELERARLRVSLSDARLEALQNQLQPHFLFNALHAVSTLIMKGDAETAHRMLLHLSRFLRMTLDNSDSSEVPLAVELEFLDAYLRIQRVRFGDRLRVEMDIEREALPARVPSLVLQPLVENAIRHGLGAKAGRGVIGIGARVVDGRVQIRVRDNGTGLAGRAPVEGVGLGNIRARLQQLYPGEHHFALTAAAAGGTLARLAIPFTAHQEVEA